jgi:hypothetical protein
MRRLVLTSASNLWKAAPTEQKQRLQQVLFPKDVNYLDGKFRTSATCLLFNGMQINEVKNSGLVAQTVFSWNHIIQGLTQMDLLRREGLFRAA